MIASTVIFDVTGGEGRSTQNTATRVESAAMHKDRVCKCSVCMGVFEQWGKHLAVHSCIVWGGLDSSQSLASLHRESITILPLA